VKDTRFIGFIKFKNILFITKEIYIKYFSFLYFWIKEKPEKIDIFSDKKKNILQHD